MTRVDEHGRPEPPDTGPELPMLQGFLDWQRATLEWKTAGLDAAGLRATTAASTMTLAGLLKHLAWVEDFWFRRRLLGEPAGPPWDDPAYDDPDHEWTSALTDDPDELRALWRTSVERSRAAVDEVLARGGGPDTTAAPFGRDPRAVSLRWVLVHMVEEYARHNGHADLLREAVDGATGE